MMKPTTATNETAAGTGMPSIEEEPTTNDLAGFPAYLFDIDIDDANDNGLGRPISPSGVMDIARVQDIESATHKDAKTNQTTHQQESTSSLAVEDDPSSARRAKRLYLCLPVMIEYRFSIVQCTLMFLVLVLLSDGSLNGSTKMEHPLWVYNPSLGNNNSPRPKPQWFQTTQSPYQQVSAYHETMLEALAAGENDTGETFHSSHALAGVFCSEQNLGLCTYEDYCPNGQGHHSAGGRNLDASGESVQWAPFLPATEAVPQSWVQVGSMPESDGGNEDNHYGMCWTWDKWTGGREREVNIEVEWGEDSRRWILCCDKEKEM